MAEYNSAYTGAQIDGAVGAVIEKQEAWDNKVSAVAITIPKGRVKGDVDGDGKWTPNDKQLVLTHINNNTTLTEIEEWCSDADGSGVININDVVSIESMYTGSFLNTPIDYYGNWTFDVNEHYWTTDIAIDGITPNIDIVLNIASITNGIQYCDAEAISAGIRLYAYMPPIEDAVCLAEIRTGTGNVVINCRNTVDSDVFIAKYDTTTRDEIKTAYENGKVLFCKVGYYIVPFSQATGKNKNIYIFGPTQDGYQFKCNAAGWSEGKWSGSELPAVTTSDNGKFLRVVDGAWAANEVLPSDIGAAAESLSHLVTLTASGWNSTTKQQTVTCADILADVTKQEIHAMPVDTSAGNAYYSAGIMPVAQAANSLTFYAETIPTADIGVYVAIHPLKFS